MPVNQLDYISFDFETYGLEPDWAEAVQIGAHAFDGRTLEPYPDDVGKFESLMRPLYPERLDDPKAQKALDVNKLKKEDILAAPDQKVVWNNFVNWVKKFNKKGGSKWGAPIAVGQNIKGFDFKFVDILNRLHVKTKENTVLFNEMFVLDLKDCLWLWFESDASLDNYKMDTWREYRKLPKDGAHSAYFDALQEGLEALKFVRLHRSLKAYKTKDGKPLIPFKVA